MRNNESKNIISSLVRRRADGEELDTEPAQYEIDETSSAPANPTLFG